MKAHLIRIAVIVLAVVGSQPATPVAARPNDPDSTLVTLLRQPGYTFARNYVDPLDELCPACVFEPVTDQSVPWRSTEAPSLLRTVVDAVTSAGFHTPEMRIATKNCRTDLWMIHFALVSACIAAQQELSCKTRGRQRATKRFGNAPSLILLVA